jgi:uncharacterized protein (DUF983 family)
MDIIELFQLWGALLCPHDWLIPIWADVLILGAMTEVIVLIEIRGVKIGQS